MSNLNIHATINSIILLIIMVFGLFLYISKNQKDIVYIDNVKLFNGFNMTKDIKQIEEAKINRQGKELDSLYAIYKTVTDKEAPAFKNLQQQIAYKSKAFQKLQDNYTHNLSSNVWNRLNDYIKEYAQANNLKIILGANGNGNLMFGEASIDITSQIIEFSNKKYEGNN